MGQIYISSDEEYTYIKKRKLMQKNANKEVFKSRRSLRKKILLVEPTCFMQEAKACKT